MKMLPNGFRDCSLTFSRDRGLHGALHYIFSNVILRAATSTGLVTMILWPPWSRPGRRAGSAGSRRTASQDFQIRRQGSATILRGLERLMRAMDTYLLVKTLHIISATIVFGTGIGIANFMFLGHFSPDP